MIRRGYGVKGYDGNMEVKEGIVKNGMMKWYGKRGHGKIVA